MENFKNFKTFPCKKHNKGEAWIDRDFKHWFHTNILVQKFELSWKRKNYKESSASTQCPLSSKRDRLLNTVLAVFAPIITIIQPMDQAVYASKKLHYQADLALVM